MFILVSEDDEVFCHIRDRGPFRGLPITMPKSELPPPSGELIYGGPWVGDENLAEIAISDLAKAGFSFKKVSYT